MKDRKTAYDLGNYVTLKTDNSKTWIVIEVRFCLGGSIVYALSYGNETYCAYEDELN